MKRSIPLTVALWLGIAGAAGAAPRGSQEDRQLCKIAIVSPEPGEMVGRQRIVTGTAAIPSAAHVWVTARIRGIAGVWPQGGGEAEIFEGKWEVMTQFGQQHDVGAQFEVLAIVVSDGVHRDLENYVERATKTQEWVPIRLPNVVQGCPVARVTVPKTSH